MYNPKIIVGPKVNEADLGAGFYSQLGAPVALNEDFVNKIKFLGAQCSKLPEDIRLIAQAQSGDITLENINTPALPTIIAFGSGANEYRLDAGMVGLLPHVSRVEVINRYGGGDPSVIVMYTPPAPPQPDGSPSPIGERWAAMDARVGGQAYRPAVDNPMAKPFKEGDVYNGYRLVFVWVTFSNCAVWVK